MESLKKIIKTSSPLEFVETYQIRNIAKPNDIYFLEIDQTEIDLLTIRDIEARIFSSIGADLEIISSCYG